MEHAAQSKSQLAPKKRKRSSGGNAGVTADSYVVHSNEFSRSRPRKVVDIHSQRLILTAIAKIDHDLDMFNTIVIHNSELRSIFPAYRTSQALSARLQKAASEGVMTMRMDISDGRGNWRVVMLVSECQYDSASGALSITFHPDMRSLMLQLHRNYTRYQLKHVAEFTNAGHVQFFQTLRSFAFEGECEIDLQTVKARLGVQDLYPRFTDFRRRALDPAIKLINEKTDIIVMACKTQQGSRTRSLKFTIKTKKGVPETITEKAVIAIAKADGMNPDDALNYIRKYSPKTVLCALAWSRCQHASSKVENVLGYTYWQLKEDNFPWLNRDDDQCYQGEYARILDRLRLELYRLEEPAAQEELKRKFEAQIQQDVALMRIFRTAGVEHESITMRFMMFLRKELMLSNLDMNLRLG